MTIFVFANNVDTTLAGNISSSATSLTLSSSANLPTSIPTGYVFVITLNDAATRQNFEVIYATNVSGSTLSGLIRGQEGTSALSWSTGDFAYSAPTAGQMQNVQAGHLLGIQKFSTPGTFTYTPTAGMNTVIAYVQAAGGGSDGLPATSSGQFALSVPGYSGALAVGKFTAAQIGSSQTVIVGAGGSPGAAGGGSATAGGNSSLGSLAVATGGPAGNGHYGPTASAILIVGNVALPPTATGGNIFNAPGSQGGASMGGANASASGNLAAVGGVGGASPFSAGGPGTGGGGAAIVGSQPGTQGNSGLDGIVLIYEYS
ncbi:hypothetical protein J2801_003551 [Paraburkholderia phenoliruptrix]|uniref:hypothetical protein n=1 Tax=Paraburkholderia phenoliruptrix TaxID=252970 RepID=UPI0028601D8D|nr:hypothetical protein [Paraburkholderia phenoliruptrix]MDR6421263.1 hypothetical protein [Paraburkholderia phenoliruptrix]